MERRVSWVFGLAYFRDDVREIEVSVDGLLVRASQEVLGGLLEDRPKKSGAWYFNASKDREIATSFRGLVTANP